MAPTVRLLRRAEAHRASLLLAAAFADDPFIGWFLRDSRRRRLALPRFFRSVLHDLLAGNAVYAIETDEQLRGIAAWAPPGATGPPRAAWSRAGIAAFEFRALFPHAAEPMLRGFESLAAHHPEAPHWYLAFVGIDPGWQRHGLGRLLLEPVLEQADADANACYLETPFPDTKRFYEGLGFVETDRLHPVAGAPPIITMTRPAHAP